LLSTHNITSDEINPYLENIGSATITEKQKASKILLRPNISLPDLMQHANSIQELLKDDHPEVIEQAEIQIKYERYIEKEVEIAEKMSQLEELIIPENFDFDKISALSKEAMQKFKK